MERIEFASDATHRAAFKRLVQSLQSGRPLILRLDGHAVIPFE
jgi:hypothetical protein